METHRTSIEINWVDRFGNTHSEADVNIHFDVHIEEATRDYPGVTETTIDRVEWDDTKGIVLNEGDVIVGQDIRALIDDLGPIEQECSEMYFNSIY